MNLYHRDKLGLEQEESSIVTVPSLSGAFTLTWGWMEEEKTGLGEERPSLLESVWNRASTRWNWGI